MCHFAVAKSLSDRIAVVLVPTPVKQRERHTLSRDLFIGATLVCWGDFFGLLGGSLSLSESKMIAKTTRSAIDFFGE